MRSGSSPSQEARFVPGAVLDGRYRILGLVGRGGMGEVYRADDLKLGQPVALKFLPEALQHDPSRLERFLNEVRTARQVSHANVCRVYDVGETEGTHYLSMEYVDGEDLGSLLRRIGRLPTDKAIEIARQLCAGLAAAHSAGILHRDLKPANVMIDGRGQVRITDFGLAAIASEISDAEIRSGTPAYMAPEQLTGHEVSERSDIYALGLVLYELLTGRRTFRADTVAELSRMHQQSAPASPSTLIDGLDPALEAVVLRCLEKDPRERPPTALAVAAALPGGDPLAAALAAGETPSPEMVAEAGGLGGMRPSVALACLLLVVVDLVLLTMLSEHIALANRASLDRPPQALAVRAREIAAELGHTEPPVDRAYGFRTERSYLSWVIANDPAPERWDGLATARPTPITFWYRESPDPLAALGGLATVSPSNPPTTLPGMVNLRLNADGTLLSWSVVPPQHDATAPSEAPVDWTPLLAAAGLSEDLLRPVEPEWNPPHDSDLRRAWEGTYPGQPDVPVRVEVGAYRGQPSWMRVILPWTEPRTAGMQARQTSFVVANFIGLTLVVVVIVAGAVMARRNLRLGRGDRRGAFRLACVMFVMNFVSRLLVVHHVPTFSEVGLVFVTAAFALLMAALAWLFYIALEPYMRRLWPDALISWSRLLSGRVRDPRIGRDLLIGGMAGVLIALVSGLTHIVPEWLGGAMDAPRSLSNNGLYGLRGMLSLLGNLQNNALITPMGLSLALILLRGLVRRSWIALGLVYVTMTAVSSLQSTSAVVSWYAIVLVSAALWGVVMVVVVRYGLFASCVMFLFNGLLVMTPMTLHVSRWYGGSGLFAAAVILALTFYGFWTALAGRPLIRDGLLEG